MESGSGECEILDVVRQAQRAGTSMRRNNLPAQLTSFIGREREIDDLKRCVSRRRACSRSPGPEVAGRHGLPFSLRRI